MDEVVQGVIDTVDEVTQYRIQLAELLESVNDSKSQVTSSGIKSKHQLESHFKQLRTALIDALDRRKQQLEDEINDIEEDAMSPLIDSENIIKQQVANAKTVMDEGKHMLSKLASDESAENIQKMIDFKKKVNEMSLNSLPEVPALSEVPCIHVDLPENKDTQKVIKTIQEHGKVLSRAPVQITDIQQRPGSLMVKWTEVEEESWLDLNEYRLQFCTGLINEADQSQVFHTAYQGANTCHVVRHLQPSRSYTFMVCGRAEGATNWSPWSVPKTAVTNLQHYEWQSDIEGYELSNENQTACRCESGDSDVLYSSANSYVCGHTIVFKVLDAGREGEGMDGVALSASNDDKNSLLRGDTIFVSCEGSVYIDGQVKTTKLPPLTRGSVLTFDTVVLQPNKVRVTIEVNERIVTFDWSPQNTRKSTAESPISLGMVPFAGGGDQLNQDKCLYFAMHFANKDWKLSVE